jgi:hypothetical protein
MKTSVVFHSALAPNAVADTLRRSIDEERRTLFSLSGYQGSLSVLGEVTDNTFCFLRGDLPPFSIDLKSSHPRPPREE